MRYLKVHELRSGRFITHEEGEGGEIKTSQGHGGEGSASSEPRGGKHDTQPTGGAKPDRDKPRIDIDDGLAPRFRQGRRREPELPDWVALVGHVKTIEEPGEVTVHVRGPMPSHSEQLELLRALPPGVAVNAFMKD